MYIVWKFSTIHTDFHTYYHQGPLNVSALDVFFLKFAGFELPGAWFWKSFIEYDWLSMFSFSYHEVIYYLLPTTSIKFMFWSQQRQFSLLLLTCPFAWDLRQKHKRVSKMPFCQSSGCILPRSVHFLPLFPSSGVLLFCFSSVFI